MRYISTVAVSALALALAVSVSFGEDVPLPTPKPVKQEIVLAALSPDGQTLYNTWVYQKVQPESAEACRVIVIDALSDAPPTEVSATLKADVAALMAEVRRVLAENGIKDGAVPGIACAPAEDKS